MDTHGTSPVTYGLCTSPLSKKSCAPAIEMRQLLLKLLSPMDSFCCGPALGNGSPKHGRMVVMVWDF